MKTFKEWLDTSTKEVQALPDMGKKLSYAMYKQRILNKFDKDDSPENPYDQSNSDFKANLLNFAKYS